MEFMFSLLVGAITSSPVFPSASIFGLSDLEAEAFGVEAFGTAVLAAVVFAMTHVQNKDKIALSVPVMVSGTVYSLICTLAPLTQAGLNPARDFGPRLVAYVAGWTDVAFQDCWLYIAAPILGAIAGAALVDKVLYAETNEAKETLAA